MLSVYQLPRVNDQFKFEQAIKEPMKHTNYAFDIDKLDGWQIQIVIQTALSDKNVKRITFCSKQTAKLYAIGMSFKYGKLWFVDTETRDKLEEHIDGVNFITVARV